MEKSKVGFAAVGSRALSLRRICMADGGWRRRFLVRHAQTMHGAFVGLCVRVLVRSGRDMRPAP